MTGTKVADQLKKNGLTLYAVVPPPFIAPEYQEIVDATHGRSYNIITEEGRLPFAGARDRPFDRDRVFADLSNARGQSKTAPIAASN